MYVHGYVVEARDCPEELSTLNLEVVSLTGLELSE